MINMMNKRIPSIDPQKRLTIGQGYKLSTHDSVQYFILNPDDSAVVTNTIVENSTVSFSSNESSEEKFRKFGINGHAKVSILFGLFSCGGDFKFLTLNKSNTKTVRAVLLYQYETSEDSVAIDLCIDKLKAGKILKEETDSSHIVTKVVYGGYATCSFEYDMKESESVFDVEVSETESIFFGAKPSLTLFHADFQAKMHASLNVIFANVDVDGGVGYANNDSSFLSTTKMEIRGTFLHDSVIPAKPQDVVGYFRNIPSLINKASRSHVRYELIPWMRFAVN
ncbi:hypothetical protein HDU81_001780 [Chytriomyces hyalinus]|nr:hypothetical protein HDU81_001780 [Chytriomyces hyalinus]